MHFFSFRIGRIGLSGSIEHPRRLIGTQMECHRVTGAANTTTGKQPREIIVRHHVLIRLHGPADRLTCRGHIGRVGFLARQKDTSAISRAALIPAPGQLTGPFPLPVPKRHLRQRRQRERYRARMTCLLSKYQRRAAMRRSRILLTQIAAGRRKESTGLRADDIQVAGLPQPLMLLQ